MIRRWFVRVLGRANVWLYRKTAGRLGGRFHLPVLLLTTTGRKSGRSRTTPLLCLEDGDNLAVVASFGGSPTHPSWFLNLREHPEVEVEIGRERTRRRARVATEEEQDRLWPRLVEHYPAYAKYQQKTARQIPVVLLEPLR